MAQDAGASVTASPAPVIPDDDLVAAVDEIAPGPGPTAGEEDAARIAVYVPDLIELEVSRGGRVDRGQRFASAPGGCEASSRAADELADLLGNFHEPGLLIIAGDGFEMLAEAPDIDRILDSHPQFTSAVKEFADQPDHRLVILPGNHDGQLAWDGASIEVLRSRLGMSDISLSCDLVLATGDGRQVVRVVHGNQLDPYNTFEDPRSPVDTPLGHHIVRQVLPPLETRAGPGSLLEGIQWFNGDPTDLLGSRLLYRKVVGRLWWLAVPFAAALLLRFLSFAPGTKPLLHHHTERWLVSFGVLIVGIAVITAVVGIATMLRVNRALADASISDRGDVSASNAAAREEAARLVATGHAGLVTGHTHEPEISQIGAGFYANTGCGTEVVRARKARFGLPGPVRACPTPVHGRVAGRTCPLSVPLARGAAHRSALGPRATGGGTRASSPRFPGSRRAAAGRGHLANRRAGLASLGAPAPGSSCGCVHAAAGRLAQCPLRPAVAHPLDPAGQSLAALRHPPGRGRDRGNRWPGPGRRGQGRAERVPAGMACSPRHFARQYRQPSGA